MQITELSQNFAFRAESDFDFSPNVRQVPVNADME